MITYDIEQVIEKAEYLQNVISVDEFRKWKKGHKVLINGTTGIGKSFFLLNNIYDSFKKSLDGLKEEHPAVDFSNRKILFLTNRNALKEQLEEQYGDHVEELVEFMNYQELIARWKMELDIPQYDLIVADECHYFFSDSSFSSDSDIALRYLLEERNDALIIYLSATPKLLIEYLNQKYPDAYFDFAYKFKKAHRVSNCCLWKVEDQLFRELKRIPADEKILFFKNDVLANTELKKKFSDDNFDIKAICSLSDSRNKQHCDRSELNNIKNNEKFNCKMLLSTTVIDNGVSISDPNLKHIVLDNILDLDVAAQCLGRKRIEEDETITLYIRIPHKNTVEKSKKDTVELLKVISTLQSKPLSVFCRRYGRDDLEGMVYPVVDGDSFKYIINDIKHFKYRNKYMYLYHLSRGDSRTYVDELFKHMEYEDIDIYYLWDEIRSEIVKALDNLVGVKLFGDDKKRIADSINIDGLVIIKYMKQVSKYNDFFRDNFIPYILKSKTEGSGERRGNKYWILESIS